MDLLQSHATNRYLDSRRSAFFNARFFNALQFGRDISVLKPNSMFFHVRANQVCHLLVKPSQEN